MKRYLLLFLALTPFAGFAQDHPHFTMFMFNKLVYNPGYTGSRNVLSINAMWRNQWDGIDGAPKNIGLTLDAPVGKSTEEYHRLALGLVLNKENTGPVDNSYISANAAYRIPMREAGVLSIGLQAGVSLYSAKYSDLDPLDKDDNMLQKDVKNAILPNAGLGVYWSNKRAYAGLSIPTLIENYYDKNQANYPSGKKARQLRSYYLSGGYSFRINDELTLLPQVIARYAADGNYKMPFNADINLTGIIYKRFMVGVTYRTDQSLEAMVHVQVLKRINLGYAYDYVITDLNKYAKGTHEIVLGFDLIKDRKDYDDPRFIRNY